jgi:hypothetical protein
MRELFTGAEYSSPARELTLSQLLGELPVAVWVQTE